MGEEPPTRAGMGEAGGGWGGASRRASEYGVRSRTLAVIRASPAAFGIGITDTPPWNMAREYCASMRAPPGCGPRGLASPVSPLPSSTKRRLPSRSNSTLVGYHPTGIHPCTSVAPGFETSATVTVLLSALATTSVRPSGEGARPVGVDPTGAWVPSATEICSPAFQAATSTTHTALVLAHATNSRAPSRLRTMAFGCSPTATSPFDASVHGSSIRTLAPPHTDTNKVCPSGDSTQV